jgi:hypothetical protein
VGALYLRHRKEEALYLHRRKEEEEEQREEVKQQEEESKLQGLPPDPYSHVDPDSDLCNPG